MIVEPKPEPLRLRQMSLCLVERRLKGPRIDLEEKLTFLNKCSFGVRLLDEIARDLGFDLNVR